MKKVRLRIIRPSLLTMLKISVFGFCASWGIIMILGAVFVAIVNPRGFFAESSKLEAIGGLLGFWIGIPITGAVIYGLPTYIAFRIFQRFINLEVEFYVPADCDAKIVESHSIKSDRGIE